VIKVESVSKGDATRHRGGTDAYAAPNGMSISYLTQAVGKKSLAGGGKEISRLGLRIT
jgi:CoA:oxalate CoA-transferase